jgi:hypothetical protein
MKRNPSFILGLGVLCVFFVGPVKSAVVPRIERIAYSSYLNPEKLTIVISFDGGDDLERWNDLLEFGKENDMKFTIFVSGAYLIPIKPGARIFIPRTQSAMAVRILDLAAPRGQWRRGKKSS